MALGNANVIATLPYAPLLELCMIQGPLQWDILATKPNICQGYLELPDAPGLGVTLAEGLQDRFPYIEGHYAIQVER
jgi:L-alanine-DL-glutamate epimerase-like enolase superfamily enzyme